MTRIRYKIIFLFKDSFIRTVFRSYVCDKLKSKLYRNDAFENPMYSRPFYAAYVKVLAYLKEWIPPVP
jgi:hypothetical protein